MPDLGQKALEVLATLLDTKRSVELPELKFDELLDHVSSNAGPLSVREKLVRAVL